jgi:four helix bundle protein
MNPTKQPMRFEDLEAWQSARQMTQEIYSLTRDDDISRDFGLCSQVQRAGVSTMSNIAEGFERQHIQEKLQFYNVAHASTAEVRSLTYVIEDNYAKLTSEAVHVREKASQCGRLLTGLIRSTETRKRRNLLFFSILVSSISALFVSALFLLPYAFSHFR